MKKQIKLERVWRSSLQDVWDLWTTREGIESWWGPDGFSVKVRSLDLRPGGVLRYAMIASGAEQIAFMKREGMPTTTENSLTYSEVVPLKRLAWTNLVDFVPGVGAYQNDTLLELHAGGGNVRMVLTLHAMHDEVWTQRMSMGWEMELGKLGKLLQPEKTASTGL